MKQVFSESTQVICCPVSFQVFAGEPDQFLKAFLPADFRHLPE
jgi:hypothetical protein